jgi:hypothetical protein
MTQATSLMDASLEESRHPRLAENWASSSSLSGIGMFYWSDPDEERVLPNLCDVLRGRVAAALAQILARDPVRGG